MPELRLKPVMITSSILDRLEKKKLIRTFKPTSRVLQPTTTTGIVDLIYSSDPRYGSHKLICIGKNATRISLTTHPDNEEFLILNQSQHKFRPLFLIIGLNTKKELEQKAKRGKLSSRDFMALKLKYNDYKTSLFVMLKGTVHCEVTVPGKQKHPVFFVTEPANLNATKLNLEPYQLILSHRP
ncbi:MAG: hypothetical protein JW774_03850 [Candidatus Aureabacteria bacterium]|nr:hypothetical protein [Candidatus Auribacterota bacterium]